MPIEVYGKKLTKLVLPNEADAGIRHPRTLNVVILSDREANAYADRRIEIAGIEDDAKREQAFEAFLADHIKGWENIDGEFSVAALRDKFTAGELGALLSRLPFAMAVTDDDRKK